MLPKKQKLNLGKSNNRSIFSSSEKFKTAHFLFFFRSGASFKASVVIPKRKVSLAAKRNRLKRRIYSILDDHQIRNRKIQLVVLLTKAIKPEAKISKEITQALDLINERNIK